MIGHGRVVYLLDDALLDGKSQACVFPFSASLPTFLFHLCRTSQFNGTALQWFRDLLSVPSQMFAAVCQVLSFNMDRGARNLFLSEGSFPASPWQNFRSAYCYRFRMPWKPCSRSIFDGES